VASAVSDLYHYTCRHRAELIGRRGVLDPSPQPLLRTRDDRYAELVWLTDLAEPDAEALGLTSHMLQCDRTEVRYRVVDPSAVEPWRTYRLRLDRVDVSALELGRRHDRWYVSARPVEVERSGRPA
jgi:hypothetical protein